MIDMDAMKEALRRKILEMKGGGGEMGAPALMGPGGGDDQMKDETDLAPSLEGEGEAGLGENPPEQLLEILAALADHEAGSGRSPNGLQERAAVGAKEKLAAMKGKKEVA